jgi:lysophospholipase L1-like esterase
MSRTFPAWYWSRIPGLAGLGLLCLMSPAASAVTSGSLLLARTFDKTVAVTNSPILVTATLTNTSPDALRGFYYFDEVPTSLKVTTVSVTRNGVGLTNASAESGLDGEPYAGYTLRRWSLETPTNFMEANPLPPQGVVRIVYSISCATTGTFTLQDFGCVACKPDKTNTLFGYSGTADEQTVTFVPGDGPVITTPPASQLVVAGASVTFSVAALATQPLSYQWRFNGAALTGATNTNLALSNAQPTNGGSYTVVVTDSAASVTSAVAVLTVLVPPAITAQPQSLTNVTGATASFTAATTGSTPLNYQWRLNGATLANGSRVSGVTNGTLTITNVQPADAGSYTLLVTNGVGAVTSAVATLTVNGPPVITTPPASQAVVAGASVSFNVTAAGTQPLSYRWRFNGTNLGDGGQVSGSGGATLTVSNVQLTNAGGYSVVVTNVAGAVTSVVATLSVTVPGSCFSAPAGLVGWWPGRGNANDIAGTNNGTLQGGAIASATGLAGMAFNFDGTNGFMRVPDSPALKPANLTIEAWVLFSALNSWVSGAPSGDQYIVFKQNTRSSDFEGYDLGKTRVSGSDVFRFLVSSASGQAVDIHSTTALATGVWYHVAGVRGSNFTQIYVNGRLEGQATVTSTQDYGAYPLLFGTSGNSSWDGRLKGLLDEVSLYNRALSSNEIVAIYTAGASGKCKAGYELSIAAQPLSQTVPASGSASFAMTALGTAPLRYQWRLNGAALTGATNANLALSNVQPTNGGSYTVVVTNSAASMTSAVAVLTVLVPPAITAQPQNLTNVAGTTASFSAAVTGSTPLTCHWRLNGADLASSDRVSGVTNGTLTISNVQPVDAGSYTLVATNGAGAATSAVATLTVNVPPAITTPPTSQAVVAGASVSFSVTAAGTQPLGCRWRFNGVNLEDGGQISGSSGATLTVSNVQAANAGSYSVVVKNVAGELTSAIATLTVSAPKPSQWDNADIGAVWSDNFDRPDLGADWIILGGANASIVSNELFLAQTDYVPARQVYYQPWLTCSDHWTLRWTERFGTMDASSLGVGVGLKNFQAEGGDDRGYNALLSGAGTSLGSMGIERWDGSTQVPAASGPAMALAPGNVVDCSLTRSGWTISATASNRANGQVSATSIVFSHSAALWSPTVSRICLYSLGGTVYVDNVSFSVDRRKPARFIVIGDSISEGSNASSYQKACVSVLQSNFTDAVCNDSGSWNSTSNAVSLLPEILAHQPETAILMIGGNDLLYGYPASQWQGQYSNLVSQLQAQGIKVKHCLPSPRSPLDLRPLVSWISSTFPAADVIDTWTPLLQGSASLNPAYDSGDGVHPNDAGHLLIGQIIATHLAASASLPPQSQLLAPFAQDGAMTLTLLGQSGSTYAVEVSGDLLQWSELKRVTLAENTVQINDSIAQGPRFYRARWVR